MILPIPIAGIKSPSDTGAPIAPVSNFLRKNLREENAVLSHYRPQHFQPLPFVVVTKNACCVNKKRAIDHHWRKILRLAGTR